MDEPPHTLPGSFRRGRRGFEPRRRVLKGSNSLSRDPSPRGDMSTTPAAKGTQQGVERVLDPPSTLWESMMAFQNQPTTLGGAGSNPAAAVF